MGDKLAENWIFIDLLHFLSLQGLMFCNGSANIPPRDQELANDA